MLVLFQFLPCFFLILALPHYFFLRLWAGISQFKTLYFPTLLVHPVLESRQLLLEALLAQALWEKAGAVSTS